MFILISRWFLSSVKKSARLSIQKLLITAAFLFFLSVSWAQAQYSLGDTLSVAITFTADPTAWNSVTVISNFPSELTYNSCTGAPCSGSAGAVTWIVGNVAQGQVVSLGYTFTITSCSSNTVVIPGPIIDVGSPSGASTVLNPLSFTIICSTDTPTNTVIPNTPTITDTPTLTVTSTATSTTTNTFTITDTPTITNTATITDTLTSTGTPTNTATVTPTYTPTNTCTVTPTFSPTPTYTPTCVTYVWPDPYNPKTAVGGTLRFSCMNDQTNVFIYTVSGELVQTLNYKTNQTPPVPCQSGNMWGTSYCWNGRNSFNFPVATGIYLYVVQQGNQVTQRGKFLLVNTS
jgi:hypothetical protein